MSTPRTNPVSAPALEDKIRIRAYELFEERGYEHGRDLDDWLQAEAEFLRARIAVTPIRPPAAKRARSKRNGK